MNDERRTQQAMDRGESSAHFQTMKDLQTEGPSPAITIAATFTADPLRQPLQFWMDSLQIPLTIAIAPYGQLMQELLNPGSGLSRNTHGLNALLIRIEDWVRDRLQRGVEDNRSHLEAVARDFAAAVRKLSARSSAGMLVIFCPPSPALRDEYASLIERLQREVSAQLSGLARVQCCSHVELGRLYPVDSCHDERSDRIAHIPYTRDYYTAIATWLARRVAVQYKPPYKVIAVDCDNTLWKGICGEDGAGNVELTPAHLEFQQLLVRQHDAGVLLCLCSKNNPEDVDAVFRARPEMPLRPEHFICSRVNWNSKSANLRSLAAELDLSLDSVVFIDDSAIECAEVRAHCPAVLVLQLPQGERECRHFLDHVWAFDRTAVTAEARQRTEQYRQNRARAKALETATDLEQFLASLELQVDISVMAPHQLARVAELVQRTNQFNLTGIRRGSGELEALIDSASLLCLVACVRDRFGDYGLVGAVLLEAAPSALTVDTFVLSCRVLGRGVEHRIVNELGRLARQRGAEHVVLKCRHTERNEPARTFLRASFTQFERDGSDQESVTGETAYIVPVEYARSVTVSSAAGANASAKQAPVPSASSSQTPRHQWHETAFGLSRVAEICSAMERVAPKVSSRSRDYVAPRTPTEAAVAKLWTDVLGIPEIGVHDDFIELGGDSLLAVRVIAGIGSVLGLELSIQDFFELPTVEQIANQLRQSSQAAAAIARADHTDWSPLSSAQRRLWFIHRLEGGSVAYHIPVAVRLRGKLDRQALQASMETLLKRHEVLRVTFRNVAGVPMQMAAPDCHFALAVTDLTSVEPREAEVVRQLCAEIDAPFDLQAGPLIRGRLLRLSADEHILLLTMHHIVSDGWSVGILLRELGALYGAHLERRAEPLTELPIQYLDYAQWQQSAASNPQRQEQLKYWVEHLRGAPELLELASDRPRPATQSHRGASVPIVCGSALSEEIVALSRRLNLTPAMTLHAAWSMLLARLSGQADIVVGIPVANRRRRELEGLIGLFVNTLAIRLCLDDDPSASEALNRTRQALLQAYAHQDAPFEQVVDALRPTRSLGHSPIFQVMFSFQNAPRGAAAFPGLTLVEQDVPSTTAQFDLLLALRADGGDISGNLVYATDLFDRSSVERWVESFKCLLSAMARHPELPLSRLPIMDRQQRQLTLETFNADHAPFERHKLIHQLFEEQVTRSPASTALIYEGQSLSYAELNARANQLARHLRARGVEPEHLVGLCLERSLEMIVALFGVLKAGAAYVPLDPGYPAQRLAHVLQDAAPRVVLTQRHLIGLLPADAPESIALDSDWDSIAAQPGDNLDTAGNGMRSDHLAYVIYTSGSTGQPKGAMNEHRALINRLQWMQRQYQLSARDTVLQKTPFSFDVSVWEFFWTLMTGARLVVARPHGHQDPEYLRRTIERMEVTTIHFVPSMLKIFIEQLEPGQCPSLRRVICSGEELPASLQQQCFERLPHARLSNLYGPTEAAVDVTYWECSSDQRMVRVPIGRPIANLQMYILDRHLEPVPVGVAGDLYIGGVGVGRGYLNRPQLTAERFLPDPFERGAHCQGRIYKTGDIGRWRADGSIEYLGRSDYQVKIRGLRIELGEIEARLLEHAQVKEAAVLAREERSGEKKLVAYVVRASQDATVDAEELRKHLHRTLPDYMVPVAYVMLQQMPLTPSGKLDRRALPEPGEDAYQRRDYQPPQGEMERVLAGIWLQLLHLSKIGREDDFFRIGGTSLSAMQLQARLQSALSLEVPMRVIFEAPTLRELAARLEELRRLRLLEKAVRSGVDMKGLIGKVVSMRPDEIRERLREMTMERRS